MIASCHPTFTGYTAISSSPSGALESYDLKTGIPWVAPLASNPVNGATVGNGTNYPIGFTRSQLSKLWFTAKELTVATPSGTSIVSIAKIFNEYSGSAFGIVVQNPFKTMGASFCFPLAYSFKNDDWNAPGVNRIFDLTIAGGMGPGFTTDALFYDSNKYWPRFRFNDVNAGTTADTIAAGNPTVGQLTFMGSSLGCDLFGANGFYGNVDITITATW